MRIFPILGAFIRVWRFDDVVKRIEPNIMCNLYSIQSLHYDLGIFGQGTSERKKALYPCNNCCELPRSQVLFIVGLPTKKVEMAIRVKFFETVRINFGGPNNIYDESNMNSALLASALISLNLQRIRPPYSTSSSDQRLLPSALTKATDHYFNWCYLFF